MNKNTMITTVPKSPTGVFKNADTLSGVLNGKIKYIMKMAKATISIDVISFLKSKNFIYIIRIHSFCILSCRGVVVGGGKGRGGGDEETQDTKIDKRNH
jgi:hypothetical protein